MWIGHRYGDSGDHAWQFPQGGVDAGETPVEAACRELEEEVGTTKALLLRESGGFLAVGDKSDPQRISQLFKMSKKSFKTAIGNLYKQGVIEITPEGIRLRG